MKEDKEKIISFLSGFFRTDTLKEDDDIFNLGLVNSLFAMQLVLFIETEFGIAIGDEDLEIENFNTVNALVKLIERKRASHIFNSAL
ncbi:MAG TPA: acyl carrier protein [Blastocatellia bacterium]|nr:acyl carrier protein [Blastocatellia bacterium]